MFFQSTSHLSFCMVTVNAPLFQPELWVMDMKYVSQEEDGIKTLDSNK